MADLDSRKELAWVGTLERLSGPVFLRHYLAGSHAGA